MAAKKKKAGRPKGSKNVKKKAKKKMGRPKGSKNVKKKAKKKMGRPKGAKNVKKKANKKHLPSLPNLWTQKELWLCLMG